jgi:serine/threonine protein kinase
MSSSVTIPSYGSFWLLKKGERLWELGRDRLGVTYKAVDPDTGTNVALKVLTAALLSDEAVREQFFGEAVKLSKLVHPNMTALVDYGADSNEVLYVTEFVPGETLEQHVRRTGPMRPKAALELLRPVAAALTDAGQLRLQHTALSPGRILTGSANTLKLAEFGLAKSLWMPGGPNDWGHLLDPAYASPEQLRNESVDPRSDIYSLGAILWFLCTGRALFTGSDEDLAYQHQNVELPEAALARCPAPLAELFQQMLAKRVAERFEGMPDLVRAMDSVVEELNGSGASVEPKQAERVLKKKARAPQPKKKVERVVVPPSVLEEVVATPAQMTEMEVETDQSAELAVARPPRRSSGAKWLVAVTVICTILGLALFSTPYALPWLRQHFPAYFASNGAVTISSEPVGALVTWEGRELGRTPLLKASLPGGSHVLELSLAGYKNRSIEVSVTVGSETEVAPVSLEEALGRIDITTEPAGIGFQVVSANGTSISGVTPATLRDLALGDYRVTLHRLGWGDYRQTMTLAANDPVLVTHHYEGGTLKVTADQAGTSISLDGTLLGAAPVELPVSAGNHTIVATINGTQLGAKQIEVVAGQASAVNLPAPPPPVAEVRIWAPGEGNAAPTPTPAPTPKAEQATALPAPVMQKPVPQRRLVLAKPRLRPSPDPTPTPTLEQRRQQLVAKQAAQQAVLKRSKEVIDQQIAATTGSAKEAWKYRLAKWQADKAAADAREAEDRKALGESK